MSTSSSSSSWPGGRPPRRRLTGLSCPPVEPPPCRCGLTKLKQQLLKTRNVEVGSQSRRTEGDRPAGVSEDPGDSQLQCFLRAFGSHNETAGFFRNVIPASESLQRSRGQERKTAFQSRLISKELRKRRLRWRPFAPCLSKYIIPHNNQRCKLFRSVFKQRYWANGTQEGGEKGSNCR